MDWNSFITGIIGTLFAYALFLNDNNEEEDEFENDDEIEVNDFANRHVVMSCQTCRKLKRHKEIESNLFQCTKCKRHVDLRVS